MMRIPTRKLGPVLVVLPAVVIAACGDRQEPQPKAANPPTAPGVAPGSRSDQMLKAHLKGLGHMERYEYGEAVEAFREVLRLSPDSRNAKVDLAIALLNDTGMKAEEAKKGGASASSTANFDEALKLLDEVARGNQDPRVPYCRGVIHQYLGNIAQAHEDFKAVLDMDPNDAHAWVYYGMTLPDPERPNMPAGLGQTDELLTIYRKAVELNPYLATAWFKLFDTLNRKYITTKDPEEKERIDRERKEVQALWNRLYYRNSPTASGESGEMTYGQMGKYATVRPGANLMPPRAGEARPPRFEPPRPIRAQLPEGHRWATRADFKGDESRGILGRFRDRFGVAAAHFDADRDGKTDLYLAGAVVGPEGPHDVLLMNRGDGRFEDASDAFGLPSDAASLGVAAGDFDADGFVDLMLTGVGRNRLLRNKGGQAFEDISNLLGDPPSAVSPTARWLDLDQDGDLDLIVLNYTAAEHAAKAFTDGEPPPGMPNSAYRNDGTPPRVGNAQVATSYAPAAVIHDDRQTDEGLSLVLTPWDGEEVAPLLAGDDRHTSLAALDLDDDRDIDLVLTADGVAPRAALNDRLGRFSAKVLTDLNPEKGPINGAAVLSLDLDERTDLVLVSPTDRLSAWKNGPETTSEGRPGFALSFWPTDARTWRQAFVADVDLDGRDDLLGLGSRGGSGSADPIWSRNEGHRLATTGLMVGPPMRDRTAPLVGLAWADLAGDALPEVLLIHDGVPPILAKNLGNGHHWLALDLSGNWKFGFDFMRTNPHGLGATVLAESGGLDVVKVHTTPEAGPAQSIEPVVLGLGGTKEIRLLRLRWPDGVMQAELNLPVDQKMEMVEYNRKTGSCPVLFAFDGRRYVCLGDFLGGGGLGYLVAPGEYSQPDRDEAVAIAPDQLREVNGRFLLSITEPMDELAYLDRITLEVVDRPPGVKATPDERFAPGGNRPTGELIAWREEIEPERATDLEGRDVSSVLRDWDRETVDGFRRVRGWVGYAEEHGIVLDFGDQLSKYDPTERLVLCLAGWVEYPYSQTNYAAATAGVPLQPPVLERRREDGSWEVIEPDPGYPAGMPRMTTLDLTGKLGGERCVLRLRTNMECYWDRAFLAVASPDAGLVTTELTAARATLGYRGYTREYSPDGRLPLLYDYDHVDPAPLARLSGRLTRYGDVVPLLERDDDRFCLVGPGDEVRLEFDAHGLPALPEGWSRSFVLRTVGYCKDADPFTATSDTVGPMPYRGMPPYPFGSGGERPADPEHDAYLRTYQTRVIAP